MPVSLVDLLPSLQRTEEVAIGEVVVDCHPITLTDIARLIADFPEVASLLDERNDSPPDIPTLISTLAPKAIGMIIAAGTGHAGDEAEAVAAAQFPAAEQTKLLGAIVRLTSPAGLVPLVQEVTAILGTSEPSAVTRAPDGALPSPLPNSSAMDTTKLQSGDTTRAN